MEYVKASVNAIGEPNEKSYGEIQSSSYTEDDNVDDIPTGRSDVDFRNWIHEEMTALAPQVQKIYPKIFEECAGAVTKWRKRFRGNPSLWKRIFKQNRVIKEVVEAVPVIDTVQNWMEDHEGTPGKINIVDLCSGKGYLSMLLSEILPADRVEKCLLIDKAWPLCHSIPKPHHMSWEHIYGNLEDEESPNYFTTWPIPLVTCKQNLKQSRELRQLRERFATRRLRDDDEQNVSTPYGPVLILAVHLCGTLSIQAVKLFLTIPSAQMLVLKPCCLPDIWHVKHTEVFQVGMYCFPAKDVCARGNWTTQKKGRWDGPPRWHLFGKFQNWCQYLREAMDQEVEQEMTPDVGSEEEAPAPSATHNEVITKRFDVPLQTKGGFQNTFLYAEKQ